MAGMLYQAAQAHVISIVHGTAMVLPDRIDVELTVDAEDFVHYYGASAAPGHAHSDETIDRAAARHADQFLEHFIIRSADGERLSGRVVTIDTIPVEAASAESGSRHSRIDYLLEYSLSAPPRYLSFQQTLGAGDAALPSQLYLNVRGAGTEKAATLRLTSGGNLETLQFHWPDAASMGASPEIIGPLEELKSIAARVQIDDAETRVQIDLPLPLLETFLPLRRVDRDFLDPSEQQAACSAVQAFLRGHLPLSINGHSAAPRDLKVALLTLDSTDASDGPQRLSAWTTRVRATQSYPTSSKPLAIALRWTLFNPLVLEVQAVIACGHQVSTHRLSTYQPTLHWKPTATGELDGHRTARSFR